MRSRCLALLPIVFSPTFSPPLSLPMSPFPTMTRMLRLLPLLLLTGLSSLRAESEWRPWLDKITARLGDSLTPAQRSALGQPPVRSVTGKTPALETVGKQVVVSDAALDLWGRLATAIGRDNRVPGYLAEYLRRCTETPDGVPALPDPSEIPSKKARKPVTDDRNQQLTAFNQLAATLVATELVRASLGDSTEPGARTDALALETLREGTRLAARSGYTSEALQSLVAALPAGAPAPAWSQSFLPPKTLGPALAKEIKKVERKALGR